MVTGGVDVSRSFVVVDHTKKDYECYRNGSRDLCSSRGDRRGENPQNRCYRSSNKSDGNLGVQQRKDGRRDSSNGPGLVHERDEAQEDKGFQLPPEKKRKFSPIIWDRKDKVIRDQTRKDTKSVVNAPSLPRSVDELSEEIEDRAVTVKSSSKSPIDVRISSELVSLVSVPTTIHISRQHSLNYLENGRMEEEASVQAPNIATSRWASSLDSPKEEFLSGGDRIWNTSRWSKSSVSPESGELLEEKSEGRRSQSSKSTGGSARELSENELDSHIVMDINEAQSGSSDFSPSEDVEPVSSTQGGMNMLLGSRSVDEYEKLRKISEGTYGVVYKARDKKTGEIVALKKIKMNREDEYGFPLTSLREINILLSCHHASIVNVKEVAVGNCDSVFMVMEHLEHDLKGLMDRMKQPFSTSEVKCLMIQLLEGVKYLHHNWIIHRDLKPSNLLMNNGGELKICDFGMSRQYGSPLKPYTQLVVTQWYRAPELLLGTKQYSTAIDMWSVGCIMAELLSKKTLFQGKGGSDIDQLNKIFAVLGTPSEMIWPGFCSLPGAKANFVKQPYNLLRKKFPAASFSGSPVLSDLGFDLLNRLLTYDPEKRLTVDEALNHEWFREVPLAKSKEFMPTFPSRRD